MIKLSLPRGWFVLLALAVGIAVIDAVVSVGSVARPADGAVGVAQPGPGAAPSLAGRARLVDRANLTIEYGAVSTDSLAVDRVFDGVIVARDVVTATAEFAAVVYALHHDVAHQVDAGEYLATLVAPGSEARLAGAEARLDVARANLATTLASASPADVRAVQATLARFQDQLDELMVGRQSIGQSFLATRTKAVDSALTKFEQQANPYADIGLRWAELDVLHTLAELQRARAQANATYLFAPVAGGIVRRYVDVGQVVRPGQPMFALASGGVELAAIVDEVVATQVSPGDEATITLAGQPNRDARGHVVAVAPTAEPATRRFSVRIALAAGEADSLDGASVQVRIAVLRRAGVIVVPVSAVSQRDNQTVVFVINDAVLRQRPVAVGPTDGANIEVVAGLRPGEFVVTTGVGPLNDGDRVQPLGGAGLSWAIPPFGPLGR